MNFFSQNKNIIIGIVVVIAIVLIIYFSGKKAGKRTAEGPQVVYPNGGNSIPQGWNPIPLAEELFDAMDGLFTLSGTKTAVWNKLLNLPTDEMIIAVYNAFNQKYFSLGKGTLVQWIRDEIYTDPFSDVKQNLLNKLQTLNCV
jgi:hypothetical protein